MLISKYLIVIKYINVVAFTDVASKHLYFIVNYLAELGQKNLFMIQLPAIWKRKQTQHGIVNYLKNIVETQVVSSFAEPVMLVSHVGTGIKFESWLLHLWFLLLANSLGKQLGPSIHVGPVGEALDFSWPGLALTVWPHGEWPRAWKNSLSSSVELKTFKITNLEHFLIFHRKILSKTFQFTICYKLFSKF